MTSSNLEKVSKAKEVPPLPALEWVATLYGVKVYAAHDPSVATDRFCATLKRIREWFAEAALYHGCFAANVSVADCLFQFGSKDDVIVDTGLVTREEADALWEKHKDQFVRLWKLGMDPEMCIWVNCRHAADYHTATRHAHPSDTEVIGGEIYRVTKKKI